MGRVYIIDDEPNVCQLLDKVISEEGHVVKTETDAERGLEMVLTEKPDCLLLDIKMPKKDGLEILKEVIKLEKKIKVIIITGHGDLENAMQCVKLGAYDYIAKPFDIDFIKELVNRSLKS